MSKRIAIIDDSVPFCLMVKQLLELEEHQVDIYATAEEFIPKYTKIESYDLIILDINLPGKQGLQMLEDLKTQSATKAVPVLLLSADSSKANIITGYKLGASDFLTKPIVPKQLVERVIYLLHEPDELKKGRKDMLGSI